MAASTAELMISEVFVANAPFKGLQQRGLQKTGCSTPHNYRPRSCRPHLRNPGSCIGGTQAPAREGPADRIFQVALSRHRAIFPSGRQQALASVETIFMPGASQKSLAVLVRPLQGPESWNLHSRSPNSQANDDEWTEPTAPEAGEEALIRSSTHVLSSELT